MVIGAGGSILLNSDSCASLVDGDDGCGVAVGPHHDRCPHAYFWGWRCECSPLPGFASFRFALSLLLGMCSLK